MSSLWRVSALSLLMAAMSGRWPGLRTGLQVVQTLMCHQMHAMNSRRLSQDGDIMIGGLFDLGRPSARISLNFTSLPKSRPCSGVRHLQLKYLYAMAFAVEEINANSALLPGVRLGYRIVDSCGEHGGIRGAMSMIARTSRQCVITDRPSYSIHSEEANGGGEDGQYVPLVIGADSSVTGKILSTFLGPMFVPVISYLATCPCLSDRQRYPNFFRTIPSDIYQARAMAWLAIRFNWTWVGAIVAKNDYGLTALKSFQEEIQGKGVCLAFALTLSREAIRKDIRNAAQKIQASNAKVIFVFSWYTMVQLLLQELVVMNVTDRQFVASEAWSTSEVLLRNVALSSLSSGVLGIAIQSSPIAGFEEYLRHLHPSEREHDDFLREFWESEFGCTSVGSTQTNQTNASPSGSSTTASVKQSSDVSASRASQEPHQRTSLPPCSGAESLQNSQHTLTDTSQLREVYNVYLAVYAAAYAFHSLLSCSDRTGRLGNNSPACSSQKSVELKELLQHLKKVNFTTPQGETFYFEGGDIPAKYDIVNWQRTEDGSLRLVVIGRVDGFQLHINQSSVQWSTGSNQAARKGEPECCFDCLPCAEGEISNSTGSPHCERCPPEFWSNEERTACVVREVDFLSFNETLGITLTTVSVCGAAMTTAVFVVFLCYRQTAIVRANNSELSFLLLVSLKLCFLCSLVFIGRPSVWSCRFQQVAFGISFALSVSCLQVKTFVVLAAFRSARPGADALIRWFGPSQQRGSVCLLSSIQIIICVVWLSISPPEPRRDLGFKGSKVTLECATNSMVGFALVLGYIGLLAFICLLLAFLARKLPDTFNEAKLITFSMLIFCAVWVAFVPAYVSSPGKYTVAVEIFAILASSYGLLFCIFAPKCFIILLRPERNTKKHMMAK